MMVLELTEPPNEKLSRVLASLRAEEFMRNSVASPCLANLRDMYPQVKSSMFDAATQGRDPIGSPAWHQSITRWEGVDAGLLDADDAEEVFRELLAACESPCS